MRDALKRPLLALAAGFVIITALTACDRMPDAPPVPSSAPSSPPSSAPSASSPASSAPLPATAKLARAVADRGLAIAKTCAIVAPMTSADVDVCSFDAPLVDAYAAAVRELSDHAKAHPDEVRGAAAGFLTTAILFGDWAAKALDYKPHRKAAKAWAGYSDMSSSTRGTLRLFQDFADAWNTFAPTDPIPVDPAEEYRVYGQSNSPRGYAVEKPPKPAGSRLHWSQCFDGPCLLEKPNRAGSRLQLSQCFDGPCLVEKGPE